MRWQYRTVAFDVPRGFFPITVGGQVDVAEMDGALNALGAEGWELVAALDTNDAGGSTRAVLCVFKRPAGKSETADIQNSGRPG